MCEVKQRERTVNVTEKEIEGNSQRKINKAV